MIRRERGRCRWPTSTAGGSSANGRRTPTLFDLLPDAAPPAPVLVRHPRARQYVLRVTRTGEVRVTIPRRGSRKEALAFAAAQQVWIERQRRRLAEENARPRPASLTEEAQADFRETARRTLPARLLELAALHQLTVSRVSVRSQRSRWGSCSRGGHICLNWRLVLMPDSVRDYVMIHELMHLRRMDHSPRFWKLVAAACPGYREARRWLREHQDGWI